MRPGFCRRRCGFAAGLLSAVATFGCASASNAPALEAQVSGSEHARWTAVDHSTQAAVVPVQRVSVDHGRVGDGRLGVQDLERAPGYDHRDETALRQAGIEPLIAVRAAAVCVEPSVEPRQPTCKFDAAQSVRGVKLTQNKLRGSLRWCAGDEPMPWVSSTRAAKLDVAYETLGLPDQSQVLRPGTGTVLGAVIDHHWAIATVFDQPVLFATTGAAVALRHPDGSPAHELDHGGVFPPSKGAMLRFPDSVGSIYRIEPDGTAVPIAPPSSAAHYVGWASNGGGQDSLWRWSADARPEDSSRAEFDREVWAIVHHRADGTIAGAPETFESPSFCADLDVDGDTLAAAPRFRLDRVAPDNVRHGGQPGRGMRVALVENRLCLDQARGLEDQRYWRDSTDRPGGAERVTCTSWRLDAEHRAPLRSSANNSIGRDAGGAMSVR